MATRRELHDSIRQQIGQLTKAWHAAFVAGREDETSQLIEYNEDMYHPPAALGFVLNKIVDETVEAINSSMDRAARDGEIGNSGKDAFFFATNALADACRMIGHRMFRLGQIMASELKYDDLTPCVCSILPDEEFEEFEKLLKDAAKKGRLLEGEGWVIPNFGKEDK